jgi:hypothetical protein
MLIVVFKVVTPYGPVSDYQHFKETHHHLQMEVNENQDVKHLYRWMMASGSREKKEGADL